ncbi:hypothetical protein [Flavobacterium hungaricum]|uniref:hypothetical protein n=1 Tax=Flavobacterium hungaricum TaxID=2082725 RepID=UPI001D1589E0|nr:hypothetical protein [Flavobacterium hungaricum]
MSSCKEYDVRRIRLKVDQKKVTSSPNEESDLISCFLKESVSRSLKGIDMSKLKYHSVERNDTILVIVKVTDIIGIEKASRRKLLFAINDCFFTSERYNMKKIYIDVEGNFSTLLVKTPLQYDLDGRFANEDLLLLFYGKSKGSSNIKG